MITVPRPLSDQERCDLDNRVAEAEKRTGAQIVLAVIERSDTYAELPWKAFALGASVIGLFITILELVRPSWNTGHAVLLAVVTTLMAGAVCALLCVAVPWFARFFLDAHHAEMEVRQHAQSLFLSHELFGTSRRTGILLLISLFERQVVVRPDTGLAERLDRTALEKIVSRMTAVLASGQVARALEEGLNSLQEHLHATPSGTLVRNELPDEIIEEQRL